MDQRTSRPGARSAFGAQSAEIRARLGHLPSCDRLAAHFHRLHLGLQVFRRPSQASRCEADDVGEAEWVSRFWEETTHRSTGLYRRSDARGGIGTFTRRARALAPPQEWESEEQRNALPLAGVCFLSDDPGAHDLDGLVHVPSTRSSLWAGSLVGPISFLNSACASCANVVFGSHSWRGRVTCIRAVQVKSLSPGAELLACYPLAFAEARCQKCGGSITADVGVGCQRSCPPSPVELGWARFQPFGGRCREVNLDTGVVRYADLTLTAAPRPLMSSTTFSSPAPARPQGDAGSSPTFPILLD